MALEILYMDFPSLVIGSGVSAIVLIISYIVYRIGIGEKSFEQALEDQKRRSIEEELKLKQKSEKVKKEKKFKKTWGKKTKDKVDSEVSSEAIQVIETKDAASEIEIIVPKEVKPMKQKNKPKPSSAQQSPDISVQEKNKKVENPPVAEKHTQEKKKAASEVEKVKTEIKVVPNEVEMKEMAVQSVPVTSVQISSQPASAVHKKKKKEQVEKDVAPMTASKLLLMIKESELEAEEIQNVIDVLLNKQKDSSGWTKTNDNLAVTKKNLHEKEQLLDQEMRKNQYLTLKVKDVREEYNAFRTKTTVQEKSSQEKISRLQQEIQNLTTKVKQVQEQLAAEREKSLQIEKDNEKKALSSLNSYEEEKANLLQKISQLETESRSGISKSEFDAMKKSREDLQKVHFLLVEQHTQLVSKEKSQSGQLSDIQIQVEKLSSMNKVLTDDYKALKESVTSLESSKKSVEEKLKLEEKHSSDLEAQVKQLSAQATNIAQLNAELNEIRSENERLAAQLVTTKERVAGDGQEVLHQNGELNIKTQEIPEKLLDEKDKLLEEKEFRVVQLTEDLTKQKAKITLLNEEIEVQKQKNNELREKNWKAMQALENAEKNADQRIKEIQTTTDQKFIQLEKDLSDARQLSNSKDDSSELSKRLKSAETEVAQKVSDYNKEVELNRHLSSEIDKVNESHKLRIAEVQKSVEELKSNLVKCQLETKECLQRICPSVTIDSSLPFEKWLLEFEQQALETIATTQSIESSTNIEELLAQKEKEYLEKQTHYEQVLSETETTLSQLQKSAESQEILWQERLKNKEQELDQVKLERDALVTEKEAMQSTFQQISQLEELQEKLKLLQNTLESAESDKSHFEQKYDEVHKNCLNLRDQLENKEKQILELQNDSSSLDRLNKEIEELKVKLEKEKKINKDFSHQMIKLNSLVKIGQDALTAEQEMVKKLKAQIESAQVSTANGTASATKTSPVTANESQPKIKNAEKSKKRMGRHKMTGCFG